MDFTITFTEQELEIILKCLAEQPYKTTAPIIQKIQIEAKKIQQTLAATPKVIEATENIED